MAKKMIIDCDENLWKEVLMYKIKHSLKNNNETVVQLLQKGLKK